MDKRFSYFPLNRHSNSHSYYGKEIYAIDETWRKLAKKKKKKLIITQIGWFLTGDKEETLSLWKGIIKSAKLVRSKVYVSLFPKGCCWVMHKLHLEDSQEVGFYNSINEQCLYFYSFNSLFHLCLMHSYHPPIVCCRVRDLWNFKNKCLKKYLARLYTRSSLSRYISIQWVLSTWAHWAILQWV